MLFRLFSHLNLLRRQGIFLLFSLMGVAVLGAWCLSFTGSRIFDYQRQTVVADGINALLPSWCECSKANKSESLQCFPAGGHISWAVRGMYHPTVCSSIPAVTGAAGLLVEVRSELCLMQSKVYPPRPSSPGFN